MNYEMEGTIDGSGVILKTEKDSWTGLSAGR